MGMTGQLHCHCPSNREGLTLSSVTYSSPGKDFAGVIMLRILRCETIWVPRWALMLSRVSFSEDAEGEQRQRGPVTTEAEAGGTRPRARDTVAPGAGRGRRGPPPSLVGRAALPHRSQTRGQSWRLRVLLLGLWPVALLWWVPCRAAWARSRSPGPKGLVRWRRHGFNPPELGGDVAEAGLGVGQEEGDSSWVGCTVGPAHPSTSRALLPSPPALRVSQCGPGAPGRGDMGLTLQGQGAHRTPLHGHQLAIRDPPGAVTTGTDCSAGPAGESTGQKGAGCAVSTGTSCHSPQLGTWLAGENQSLRGSFLRHRPAGRGKGFSDGQPLE